MGKALSDLDAILSHPQAERPAGGRGARETFLR
jgi:hypothetical protein